MTEAIYHRLKADKHSAVKQNVVYARAGEKVQQLADHGDVLIVAAKGVGFSVKKAEVLPVAATK